MKWLRRLVRLINIGAAIAVVAIGIGAWLLNSEKGTAWLVRFVERRAQPALSIASIDGTLLSRLRLGGVVLSLPGGRFSADRAVLSFDALSLLTGAVIVDELSVGRAQYSRAASAGAAASPDFDLPVNAVVRHGRVAEMRITSDEETLVLTGTEFAVSLIDGRLEIRRFTTEADRLHVSGQGQVALGPALHVTAQVDWSGQFGDRAWAGSLGIDGTLPELNVRHRLVSPFNVNATGTLRLGTVPTFDIDADWSGLALPGVGDVVSETGRAHASGSIDRFEFEGSGQLRAAGQQGDFALQGRRDGNRVDLDSLSLQGAPGKVSATGTLALDARSWDLAVAFADLDPAVVAPAWPGRIGGSSHSTGRLRPRLEARFEALDLSGRLRDVPVQLAGAVAYQAPNRWQLDALRLRSGANTVTVSGRVAEQLDLALAADVAQADQLLPQLSGSGQVQLEVAGTPREPRFSGSISGRDVEFSGFGAASVRLAGQFGLRADAPADLVLDVRQLTRRTRPIADLHAQLSGTAAQHRIDFDARAEQWTAHSTGRGDLVGGVWRATVEDLDIDQAALGHWRLQAATEIVLERDHFMLAPACLDQSRARLCGSLDLGADSGDRLALNAKDFDVAVLQPLLPEELSVQGVYQVSLNLNDLRGSPVGSLSVDGGRTAVRVVLGEQDTVETVVDSLSVDATLKDWRMQVKGMLSGQQSGDIELAADVDDLRREDSAVSGNLSVFWPDVGFASLLSPEIGEVGGSLKIQLTMGGALNEPRVRGAATWSQGSVASPRWGFEARDIEATATSPDGSTVQYRADGHAGDGMIILQGVTELSPEAGWPTRATLSGDSIRAVQRPDAEIYVTPELSIDAHFPQIDVSGTVRVPRANLSLDVLPAQAVTPSRDVVVHGAGERPPVRPLHVDADLRVALGDDVHYAGSNLNALLSGEIRLHYRSGESADASGALGIDGKYSAYGQTLDVDRGRLVFAGPIDNPTLDVRAARKVDKQTVGVQLLGTLKSPQTRVFSEPALSEGDALSYLLFGRPLASSGQADTQTLQSAAVAMGLQQALPVVQKIGETLGLDELSVRPSDVDTGALMAGKYLSPKLYVRYSYGLFNRIGGLLLRFRVNDRLSLETRSGEQKSMDLLYTVEKP